MPRQILPATGPGVDSQWEITGAAEAWEAVGYGSSDATYIFASALSQTTDVFCGSASLPLGGRFVAVTLRYRIRSTVPASGAVVDFSAVVGGVPQSAVSVNPTNMWTTGEIRFRSSWGAPGSRPTITDTTNLGVKVVLSTPPSSGQVQISQLWVDVELLDTPTFYDPYDGALPDAIVGPRQWPMVLGTQPVSITGDNYLQIVDASAADFRVYLRDFGVVTLKPEYVTETETRVLVTSALPGPINVAILSGYGESDYAISLVASKNGPTYTVGITSGDITDPASWIASSTLDLGGKDTHFRVVIDRDPTPETYGKISVYVNYSLSPLVECLYADAQVPVVPTNATMFFGTGAGTQSTVKIDYFSYKHYKKRGDTFRAWRNYEIGTNSIVSDSYDSEIVPHILINPPGVIAGQSSNVCVLDVAQDSEPCSIYQARPLPDVLPSTYKIDLDYKILGAPGTAAEVAVQRLSDLWYWDQGLTSWVAGPAAVTLPYSASRVRQSFVTGLGVAAPDSVIVTVKNTLLPSGPHQILVYKVYLAAE